MLEVWSLISIWLAIRVGLEVGLSKSMIMDWIENRPELVTPVSGFKQLKEGVYLYNEGYDPYDGGIFHQSPLLLHLFSIIKTPVSISMLYGLSDCFIALYLLKLFRSKWNYNLGFNKTLIKLKQDSWLLEKTYQIKDWQFIALYLFSPLNLLTNLSKSTAPFSNLAIILALDGALQNKIAFSMFSLSIGTSLSTYPVLLVPSCIAILCEKRPSIPIIATLIKSLVAYLGHLLALASFGPLSVFLAPIDVNRHLRPNVGLHWYFSIEMFDHFRLFFNVVFQIHILIYVLPLIFKFKKDKVFAFVAMNGIITTFKSYPTIGDACFSNVLLLVCYPELISHFRHPLLTILLYFYGICLLPAFHHLWMNLGSGNSNFYYASTLVWSIGNGLNLIDLISSMIRRNFQITELNCREIDDECEAMVQS
ncbi:GPI transamidase subunit PIG-U [Phakopsora pachyrhizi]|uniref:GPI transamidase subunit PIG-U n=1 Tax=Phakopsora pachyrhizi TaxID=170000 RepID=A0AAV0BDY5_PHAPC|nr:GPI transamidase subunit PIG-U [Phakopsora pachyrhizi]KAI8445947.1 GPI transamidase subunit PIG-U [Phakopsora pachyrhizi]CAH7684341.1 GPI transamidase subunit PIG-U [Phakopsora pachyrhizi]CAH7684515.1 GPI transamidase subunit PIG-U [Phakopsora pachyrhizi]